MAIERSEQFKDYTPDYETARAAGKDFGPVSLHVPGTVSYLSRFNNFPVSGDALAKAKDK